MAKISDGVLRDFKDGDKMTSDAYEQDREIIRVAINDNDTRVKNLEKATDSSSTGLAGRMTQAEADIDNLEDTADTHNSRIMSLEDKEPVQDQRLDDLETTKDNHESRVSSLEGNDSSQDGKIGDLETSVYGSLAPSTFNGLSQMDMTFDQMRIGYVDSRVNPLESQLADLATNINSFPIQVPEADDTGRLQRAVNSLKAKGGGTLLIPGVLNISSTIDCTGNAYINIIGTGMLTSKIILTSSSDIPAFSFGKAWTGVESAGWSKLSDFSIVKSAVNKTVSTAIKFDSANPKLVVDHLYINGFKIGLDINNCWGITIRDCFIIDCGTGINLSRQPNSALVETCYLQRCDTGIVIDDGASTKLQNVVIERYSLVAVNIQRGKAVLLSCCYFEAAEATADSTISITRKSGYASSTVTIDNCHFNDLVTTIVRVSACDELTVTNNVLYTPEAGTVLVLSDTSVVSNGLGVCRISGNATQYWEGTDNSSNLKYLYKRVKAGANTEKGEFIIGSNGEFSKKGTIYSGTIDMTANGQITDVRKFRLPLSTWSPKDNTGYAIPNYRDPGTATVDVLDSGYKAMKLIHGGGTSWGKSAYVKALSMTELRALFGSTGLIRVKLTAMCKNSKLVAFQPTSANAFSNYYSSVKSNASRFELQTLEFSLDLANSLDYKIGFEVDLNETGYSAPIKLAILGTKDDGEIIDTF